jgi:nucleoside-diphosphate-sugar epimerase
VTRVLITGGAGFIGCHLARALLARGTAVDLLDNFARGARDEAVEDLQAHGAVLHDRDLLQADPFDGLPRNYRYVFHLAAIVGVRHVLGRPYDVLRDNVLMLDRAVAFCRTQPQLARLVFASTSEVYAGTLQHFHLPLPTPEQTPLALTDLDQPRTSYMLSKLYGEALCHHSGLPFTIVRPHNIYGPRMGMSHVIPELLKRASLAADGGVLEVHSPSHRRTFCYVDDAVELVRLVAEADGGRNATVNIGSGSPEVSMRELAEAVSQVVGKSLRIAPLPDTPGSPPRRCPDMTRATAVTGYSARTSLDEGLRLTYAWYKPHLQVA